MSEGVYTMYNVHIRVPEHTSIHNDTNYGVNRVVNEWYTCIYTVHILTVHMYICIYVHVRS